MKGKLLLLGRNGQLGREIERLYRSDIIALGRSELDLADLRSVRECIQDISPSVIVNAAAFTAVDRAETEKHLAFRINAELPEALAKEAQAIGSLLVHISTDYVFDGTKRSPYVEEDVTNPINVYGTSKLAGETAIRSSGARFLLLRTSWVFSEHGTNFVKTMLRIAQTREEVRIVSDQEGCPTSAADLAECIVQAVQSGVTGQFHASGAGPTTWADFAGVIFDEGQRLGLLSHKPRITRIGTADYPTPAQRPQYSVLDNSKLKREANLQLPPWRESLSKVLERLKLVS